MHNIPKSILGLCSGELELYHWCIVVAYLWHIIVVQLVITQGDIYIQGQEVSAINTIILCVEINIYSNNNNASTYKLVMFFSLKFTFSHVCMLIIMYLIPHNYWLCFFLSFSFPCSICVRTMSYVCLMSIWTYVLFCSIKVRK